MARNQVSESAPEPDGVPSPMDSDIVWWAEHHGIFVDPTKPIPEDVRRKYQDARASTSEPPSNE